MDREAIIKEALEHGMDPHKSTASTRHGVAYEDVTPEQRQGEKMFNFPYLYSTDKEGNNLLSQYEFIPEKYIKMLQNGEDKGFDYESESLSKEFLSSAIPQLSQELISEPQVTFIKTMGQTEFEMFDHLLTFSGFHKHVQIVIVEEIEYFAFFFNP